MEEPFYGAKSVLQVLQERKLSVQFVMETRKETDVMQKCQLKVGFTYLWT